MKNPANEKECAMIAAAFCTALLLSEVCYDLFLTGFDLLSLGPIVLIYLIILFGGALSLFLMNRKACLVFSALYMALSLYALIADFLYFRYFSIWNILTVLSYVSMSAAFVFSIRKSRVVRWIWYIPAALSFLKFLIDWMQAGMFDAPLLYIINSTLIITGLFFTGLWLKVQTPGKEA